MESTAGGQTRSARKRAAIMAAATEAFMEEGYSGTSMDDVARIAAVSKQTVYKHFADKETLFTEMVLATTDRVDSMVDLVAGAIPADPETLEENLTRLAGQFLAALTSPNVLRLRRLVIANAHTFPELGAAWYERGFQRVLRTLATRFEELTRAKVLRADQPTLAAEHFCGLLLWIPLNWAMFTGALSFTEDELDEYANAAVRAFLAAYS